MNSPSFAPAITPFSHSTAVLEFKTEVVWTASGLGRALSRLDSLYASLILARHLAVIATQRLRLDEEHLGRYWEMLEREGPDVGLFFHEWRRVLRRYGPTATQRFLFGPGQAQGVDHVNRVLPAAEVEYYLRTPSEYLFPGVELKIRRIAIASPGGFSLQGLGEPIRELREFIKDMAYRNRQEREKGDLEILKQKLDIISQRTLSPLHNQIIAASAIPAMQEIGELIHDGRLQLKDSDSKRSEEISAKKPGQKKPWQL